ncbi:DUF2796 domain-containing protein [Cupriavidus sp. 30B13]|uniref:DUF2796 domain-containing protein n=1 Tax=Cupriavidus sp. 30B13 TaxID=3384241 RepID=UPI003B913303
MNLGRTGAALAAFLLAAGAGAHEAHVHGAARLDVVQDGAVLTVHLESPLMNLFGFEHAPRSAAEQAAAQQAMARLRDGGGLFVTPPAAGCRLESVQFDFGPLNRAFMPAGGSAPGPMQAAQAASGGEHADLDADYTFRCKAAAGLRQLDVKLFDAFPALQRATVQLVTPARQAGATLTRAGYRLTW